MDILTNRNYPHCTDCGIQLQDYRTKRCRKCNAKNRFAKNRITKICKNCHKLFTRPQHIAEVQDCCSHQCGIDYWFKKHKNTSHPHWKESNIGYSRFHSWLLEITGGAFFCLFQDGTCKGNYEWANINHKNKFDKFNRNEIENFIPLCESHHVRFDRYHNLF